MTFCISISKNEGSNCFIPSPPLWHLRVYTFGVKVIYQQCVYHIFSPICGLYFSINDNIWNTRIITFEAVQSINFILLWIVLLVSFIRNFWLPSGSPANAGDVGSIPGWGRSPGGGNGCLLWYSCLVNPMERGAWWATNHSAAKRQTRLSDCACTYIRNL